MVGAAMEGMLTGANGAVQGRKGYFIQYVYLFVFVIMLCNTFFRD